MWVLNPCFISIILLGIQINFNNIPNFVSRAPLKNSIILLLFNYVLLTL